MPIPRVEHDVAVHRPAPGGASVQRGEVERPVLDTHPVHQAGVGRDVDAIQCTSVDSTQGSTSAGGNLGGAARSRRFRPEWRVVRRPPYHPPVRRASAVRRCRIRRVPAEDRRCTLRVIGQPAAGRLRGQHPEQSATAAACRRRLLHLRPDQRQELDESAGSLLDRSNLGQQRGHMSLNDRGRKERLQLLELDLQVTGLNGEIVILL